MIHHPSVIQSITMAHDDQPTTIKKPTDLPGAPMSAIIGFDFPCCFCGYNLNSLALNGTCPECGAAVNDALRGSRMQYQPLAWIQRLKIGAQLVFWGNIALMLIIVVSISLAIYEYNSSTWWMPYWFELAIGVVYLVAIEFIAIGMLMLSVSAPIRVRRKQFRARVSRTSSLCMIIAIPLYVFIMIFSWNTFSPSSTAMIIAVIAGVLIVIGCPLLYFFGLAQISMIASLIPWKMGSKRALTLQIYAPAAFVVWMIVYLIFTTIIMSQMSQSPQNFTFDWIFFGLIPLVTVILALVGLTLSAGLFLGLSRQIKAVAVESIATTQAKHSASVWAPRPDSDEERFVGGDD